MQIMPSDPSPPAAQDDKALICLGASSFGNMNGTYGWPIHSSLAPSGYSVLNGSAASFEAYLPPLGSELSPFTLGRIPPRDVSFHHGVDAIDVNFPVEKVGTSVSSNSCNTLRSLSPGSFNIRQQDPGNFFTPRKDACLSGRVECDWGCKHELGHCYQFSESSEPGWIPCKPSLNFDGSYGYYAPSNELSLSIGSCTSSVIGITNLPDQSSEVSCSDITQVNAANSGSELYARSQVLRHPSRNVGFGAGLDAAHALPDRGDFSIYCGSSGPFLFSSKLVGSKYLHVADQMLAAVASCALQTSVDIDNYSKPDEEMRSLFQSGLVGSQEMRSLFPNESNTMNAELLDMLQLVDDAYNQCLDQIQKVTSAFHDATRTITKFSARCALFAVSSYYKSLRDRITDQILLVSQQLPSFMKSMEEEERSFESSFIQRQWALQKLKWNDQQPWRPQRGLPEKSVAVLRAWMFQNFLHPYPKDSDKQLLAIKSGLTRNQVSNWFINARVRLWKPMIEEMHAEIDRTCRNDETAGGDDGRRQQHRSVAGSHRQGFHMS